MGDGQSPPGNGSSTPSKQPGRGWWSVALAGAAAFWLSNLLISLTPIAAAYRSALSIPYLPMLVEAAVGGLVIGSAVALLLARHPDRIPGTGPLTKALLLSLGALILLTVLLDVPAKLRSDLVDPGHWLLVAAAINTIRFLALGLTIGLLTARRGARTDPHHIFGREAQS